MTTTYATDHGAIWRALFDWLQVYAGLGSDSVRRLNQIAGRPALPYATMQVLADVGGGVEGEVENDAGSGVLDTVVYGTRRMTIQITMYTDVEQTPEDRNAVTRLTGAVQALRTPKVKQLFKTNGVAFLQQLASIQQNDEQLGQRWERRATVDLEFGYTGYTVVKDEGESLASVSPITEQDRTLIVQEP